MRWQGRASFTWDADSDAMTCSTEAGEKNRGVGCDGRNSGVVRKRASLLSHPHHSFVCPCGCPAGGQVDGRHISGKKNVSILIGSPATPQQCVPFRALHTPIPPLHPAFPPPAKDEVMLFSGRPSWAGIATHKESWFRPYGALCVLSCLQGKQQTDVPR